MPNRMSLVRPVLMVLALALVAATQAAATLSDDTVKCIETRQQGCHADAPEGLGGRYNGGTQSCVDGPGSCLQAY